MHRSRWQKPTRFRGRAPAPDRPVTGPFTNASASGSEEDIKGLQTALAELTDRAVPQSGRFDEETREALRTLSQRLGIGDTEVVTPELADHLAV
jgi:peptidoglycan hydrolase-like protein with peptidoglycan-binding domain